MAGCGGQKRSFMREIHDAQLNAGHDAKRGNAPQEDINDSKHRVVQRPREQGDHNSQDGKIDYKRGHQLPVGQFAADQIAKGYPRSK
ncbi:hypothetical protein D3C73_884990 [compost metagenome]